MAERFEMVFSLEGNLYVEGAPILVTEGWLRKDNVEQRTAAGEDRGTESYEEEKELIGDAAEPFDEPEF